MIPPARNNHFGHFGSFFPRNIFSLYESVCEYVFVYRIIYLYWKNFFRFLTFLFKDFTMSLKIIKKGKEKKIQQASNPATIWSLPINGGSEERTKSLELQPPHQLLVGQPSLPSAPSSCLLCSELTKWHCFNSRDYQPARIWINAMKLSGETIQWHW